MKKTIYRHATNKRLGGVCAGIADYFAIETWLVRILTVTALFFIGPFILFLYVMGWFVLDKGPYPSTGAKASSHRHSVNQGFGHNEYRTGHQNEAYQGKGWINNEEQQHDPVKVKSTVWAAGLPPKLAISKVGEQFEQCEQRLRAVEAYVTSTRFKFDKAMREL